MVPALISLTAVSPCVPLIVRPLATLFALGWSCRDVELNARKWDLEPFLDASDQERVLGGDQGNGRPGPRVPSGASNAVYVTFERVLILPRYFRHQQLNLIRSLV
jgi:hypothetical protein